MPDATTSKSGKEAPLQEAPLQPRPKSELQPGRERERRVSFQLLPEFHSPLVSPEQNRVSDQPASTRVSDQPSSTRVSDQQTSVKFEPIAADDSTQHRVSDPSVKTEMEFGRDYLYELSLIHI